MTVLVCGGRDYNDVKRITQTLEWLSQPDDDNQLGTIPLRIVTGGCPTGADRHAADWAVCNWSALQEYPADWDKYGKAAGPIRNQRMLDEEKPDLVVAFPGGRGTADMVRRANEAGVQVMVIEK